MSTVHTLLPEVQRVRLPDAIIRWALLEVVLRRLSWCTWRDTPLLCNELSKLTISTLTVVPRWALCPVSLLTNFRSDHHVVLYWLVECTMIWTSCYTVLAGRMHDVSLFVRWCLDPSQPQRITSGLKTNFTLSPSYLFHKSPYHMSCFLSLFIFRGHSTREPASGRVTYFILRANTGTIC